MYKRIVIGFSLSVALILSGCSRDGELRGDIFIVTEGAQSFKLGLVEVSAIPEAEITAFLDERKKKVDAEIAEHQLEYEGIQQDYDNVQRQYFSNRQDLNEEIGDLQQRTDRMNRYEQDGDKASSFLEAVEGSKKAKEAEETQRSTNESRAKLDQAKLKLDDAKYILSAANSPAPFFVDMPKPLATATTDADGKFTMKLPAKGRFALVAHASRLITSSKEEYYWIVWTSLDGESAKQVTLSNKNLLLSGADTRAQTKHADNQ